MATKNVPTAVKRVGNTYDEYLALVEKYKVKNPFKYELKKAAFEKKLAKLKKLKQD